MKSNIISSFIYIMTLSACSVEEGSQIISSTTTHDEDRSTSSVSDTTALGGDPTRSPGCVADFDNDGRVTPADVAAAVSAMNAGNIIADFDHNGRVEPADIALFINAFWSAPSNPACTGGAATCVSSSAGQYQDIPFTSQTATFTVNFNLTSTSTSANVSTGLSEGTGASAGGVDCSICLKVVGTNLQALNGPWSPTNGFQNIGSALTLNASTPVSITADVVARTYSVSINGQVVASQFAFAPEDGAPIVALNTMTLEGSGAQVCNFALAVPPAVPAAPTNLVASVGTQGQISLSYVDRSINETGFHIYRDSALVSTANANIVTASDRVFSNGTYQYKVRAYNTGGESADSNIVSVTVSDITAPPPVGYTDLSPTRTGTYKSKLVYVSNTGCSDSTGVEYYADNTTVIGSDPRNPVAAVQAFCNVASAYNRLRPGYPDQLLLSKGGSWTTTADISLNAGGRSATELQVISSYKPFGSSSTVRPILMGPGGGGETHTFWAISVNGVGASNLAIVGIHFKPRPGEEWTGNSGSSYYGAAMQFLYDVHTNIFLEDNRFTRFSRCISLEGITNLRLFRNIFEDNLGFSSQMWGTSGVYLDHDTNTTIEENIYLMRGYTVAGNRGPVVYPSYLETRPGARDVPAAYDSMQYIENNMHEPLVVKRNLVINKGELAWIGVFARSPVNFEDNFIYGFMHSIDLASEDSDTSWPNGTHGTAIGNIIEHGTVAHPTNSDFRTNTGIRVHRSDSIGFNVANNIIAHRHAADGHAVEFSMRGYAGAGPQNVTVQNNIMYDWAGLYIDDDVRTGNRFLNNQVQNPESEGSSAPLVESNIAFNSSNVSFSGNTYFTVRNVLNDWFSIAGAAMGMSSWTSQREPSAINARITYPNANVDHLLAYGASRNLSSIDAIMDALTAQSRDTYRSDITIDGFLNYTRAAFGR